MINYPNVDKHDTLKILHFRASGRDVFVSARKSNVNLSQINTVLKVGEEV